MPVIEIDQVGHIGPRNDITDVAGMRVGHCTRDDEGWLTGTTVVVAPTGTVGGVDVRGGGPSTRETDALAPTTLVGAVHAVCLSGGSSYGLAAADGVMERLGASGVGVAVGTEARMVVPIVPAACLFDLRPGAAFERRPDADFGRAAFDAATGGPVAQGNVGAGTGAHAGSLKGGVGSASTLLNSGATVAALVALNAGGNVIDPATGDLYGRRHGLGGEFAHLRVPSPENAAAAFADTADPWPRNTVLVVVATDARLDKSACCRVAMAAHDGLARAVSPVHCLTDGDVVFTLATGAIDPEVDGPSGSVFAGSGRLALLETLMAAAANAVTRAVVHAVLAARSVEHLTSYLDRYPSARV